MDPVTQSYLVQLAVGLLMYGILRGVEWIARWFSQRGKFRVIAIDGDTKTVHVGLYKPNGNRVVLPARDGIPERAFILEGEGKYDSNFPTWLIHRRWGHNLVPEAPPPEALPSEPMPGKKWKLSEVWEKLVAKTDMETFGTNMSLRAMAAANPVTYAFGMKHNRTQDMLLSKPDKKSIWEVLAPFILIGIIVVTGLLIFLVWKITALTGNAAASNHPAPTQAFIPLRFAFGRTWG